MSRESLFANRIESETEHRQEDKEDHKKSYSSRIVVSVFRHGEKEKAAPGMPDQEVRLTGKGKKGAVEAGAVFRLPEEGLNQAVAFGSPRKRAQETAAFVMAGEEESIIGTESLEQLGEKIDAGREYGTKIGADRRLDFDDGILEYQKIWLPPYKEGRFIDWMVKESDEAAKSVGDKMGLTYSRAAAGIASMIERYVKIAPRFDKLVNDQEKEYGDTMQRFLGTHQTLGEAFLAKVIEKTDGVAARDKFAKMLGSGFNFVEGFQVEIITKPGEKEPVAVLHYKREADEKNPAYEFHKEISKTLLEEIVEEGKR